MEGLELAHIFTADSELFPLPGVRCPNPGTELVTPRPVTIDAVSYFAAECGLVLLVTRFPGAPLSQRGLVGSVAGLGFRLRPLWEIPHMRL